MSRKLKQIGYAPVYEDTETGAIVIDDDEIEGDGTEGDDDSDTEGEDDESETGARRPGPRKRRRQIRKSGRKHRRADNFDRRKGINQPRQEPQVDTVAYNQSVKHTFGSGGGETEVRLTIEAAWVELEDLSINGLAGTEVLSINVGDNNVWSGEGLIDQFKSGAFARGHVEGHVLNSGQSVRVRLKSADAGSVYVSITGQKPASCRTSR